MPARARSRASLAAAVAAALLFGSAVVLLLRVRHPAPGPVAVYLTPWAGEDEILRVYTSVLGEARSNRQGFGLRQGITGVSRGGDEAQTILLVYLREDLGRTARDSLLAAIRASPLVSRVEPAGEM